MNRRYNMGFGVIVESPDLLDLMQNTIAAHLDDAKDMDYYNCEVPLPDDLLMTEQKELFCFSSQKLSDILDQLGVPLEDRLTICVLEEIDEVLQLVPVQDRPIFVGPFAEHDIIECDDI